MTVRVRTGVAVVELVSIRKVGSEGGVEFSGQEYTLSNADRGADAAVLGGGITTAGAGSNPEGCNAPFGFR